LSPATEPLGIAAGDFNDDGNLDLAVANAGTNNVSILLGVGDGTFGAATNFNVGTAPAALAVGDFNGDGKLDLAVANCGVDNNVSILLGDGNGSFSPASTPTVGVGTTPIAIAVGDFNGDGVLDLAVVNSGDNNISILLGNGDGTFAAAGPFSTGAGPHG